MIPMKNQREAVEKLSTIFGSYKAEWLRESMFDLFSEPSYFPELTTRRPCVLIGGRGSGKTTVLRSLSYQGRCLLERAGTSIKHWEYYGFYHKVNTNRVASFQDSPLLTDEDWKKLFAHYVNLMLSSEVVKFLIWFQEKEPNLDSLPPISCNRISRVLRIKTSNSTEELFENIQSSYDDFESYVNNIDSDQKPQLSMQGKPLDIIFEELAKVDQFSEKAFFFILDEYENFTDSQQVIMNTLIKHSGPNYTFKVGVRELGWRIKNTHNGNEYLSSPADYVRIDISERLDGDIFGKFARDVCSARLQKLSEMGVSLIKDLEILFPGLSEEEEAIELGVSEEIAPVINLMRGKECYLEEMHKLSPLQIYFFKYWSEGREESILSILDDFVINKKKWMDRYSEYKYACLFSIREKKIGVVKYFAGWNIYTSLAGKNIRYLLELVDQTLLLCLREGGDLNDAVSPRIQTIAAQNVGKKNLSELEGLSVHGAQLTKLLLGLGRIFGIMANKSAGHAPEINQFKIKKSPNSVGERVDMLIKAAIMHLAIVSFPGNKLKDESETRDKAFQLHPIFSPYFVFSYKKGRNFMLDDADIVGLIDNPRQTIKKILKNNNRSDDGAIPEQLDLFGGYYNGNL